MNNIVYVIPLNGVSLPTLLQTLASASASDPLLLPLTPCSGSSFKVYGRGNCLEYSLPQHAPDLIIAEHLPYLVQGPPIPYFLSFHTLMYIFLSSELLS